MAALGVICVLSCGSGDGPTEPPPEEPRVVVVDADPLESPGSYLKQMREARGFTLHQVAERTKIGSHQLVCIENQDFASLPAPESAGAR